MDAKAGQGNSRAAQVPKAIEQNARRVYGAVWCMGASVVVGKNNVRAYVVYSGMAGGCPRTSAGAGVRFFIFICLFKQTILF